MTKVWKYNTRLPDDRRLVPPHFIISLPRCGEFSVSVPIGSKILALKEHNGDVTLFVQVKSDERQTEVRRFLFYGTGQEIDTPDLEYVGTLDAFGGQATYHVFERRS